ncbi:unnamed protein product [Fraxinus pennsylvanica]|uniref:Uncharacterized protein n=1 Tax=Fraxinus pennsylvanica TaxID=56036 RepID=A0AAD1Z737_9LAMI|nr:unnamed protein product [Fraxinus pennsylvanica]
MTFPTRHLNLLPLGLTERRGVGRKKGNILQISEDENREKEEKNDTWHRMERVRTNFCVNLRCRRCQNGSDLGQHGEWCFNSTVPKEEVKKFYIKAIEISG